MRLRQSPSGPSVNLPSFPAEAVHAELLPAVTLDWRQGPAQVLFLDQNKSVTMLGLAPNEPTWVQLLCIQANGGSHTITFPGARTPGGSGITLTTTNGAEDILSIFWDGTTAFVQVAGLDFQ